MISQEMKRLEKERKLIQNELLEHKNNIINEIKIHNKEDLVNNISLKETYTLWDRIKKVLGMS